MVLAFARAPARNLEDIFENLTMMNNVLSTSIVLDFAKRKVSLSIKLLEELQNKEAVSKFSSPLSGKNLPFSSLSDKLDDKKKKKE